MDDKPPTIQMGGEQNRTCGFLIKLLLGTYVGIAVWGLSFYVAWLTSRDDVAFVSRQLETREVLHQINTSLQKYREQYGHCPHSLAELMTATKNESFWHVENGEVVDGWVHPFVFSTEGTNCLVTSYGRDGKPGGVGLDCDLTNINPIPKQSLMTFDQFIDNTYSRAIFRGCVICGVLAFFLTVFTIKARDLRGGGLHRLGLKIGATILGAIIAGSLMAILEIPRH